MTNMLILLFKYYALMQFSRRACNTRMLTQVWGNGLAAILKSYLDTDDSLWFNLYNTTLSMDLN